MADGLRGCYEGLDDAALARRLGLPLVRAYACLGSTQDEAHSLASAGAPAGTLVVADEQVAGRGRGGRRWSSRAGSGVWMSLVERPRDTAAIEVLALRLGLALATALDPLAAGRIQLKWPNDLYAGGGKLAGILVEARWRDASPEWMVIGIGINIGVPDDHPDAAALSPGVDRLTVLATMVVAAREAARGLGPLTPAELDEFARRDLALGHRCSAPAAGVVEGIAADGALLVASGGDVRACRGGSLVLEADT